MRQRAGEIFGEPRASLAGEGAGLLDAAPERVLAVRQPEGFEPRRAARFVLAEEHEVARVRHQHRPVAAPIAADLIARGGEPGVVAGGLDLDDAAFRQPALARPAPLDLPRRVEAEVGMSGALVGELADAEHLRPERRADGVQQIPQRRVVGELPRRSA